MVNYPRDFFLDPLLSYDYQYDELDKSRDLNSAMSAKNSKFNKELKLNLNQTGTIPLQTLLQN